MQNMIEKPDTDLNTLAGRLRWARENKKWSQPHLALIAEVSTSTVGMIESGARQNKGSLPALADALGVRYRWLHYGEAPMIADPSNPATSKHIETTKAVRAQPMGEDAERGLLRMMAVLHQIPSATKAAAIAAATAVLLDYLPPPSGT